MGYYDFPHTRNYDTDLGYLINWFKTNKNKIEKNTAITIEKALSASEDAIKAYNSATSASNSAALALELKNQTQALKNLMQDKIDQIDTNTSRINNLATIDQGSITTTADAELVDIRVGYNGTTYASAGDGVRGQVTELNSEITNIDNAVLFDKETHLPANLFEIGSLMPDGTNNPTPSPERIRTKDIVYVNRDTVITIKVGYRMYIFIYSLSGVLESTQSWWYSDFKIPKGKGFKLLVAKTNEVEGEKANIIEFSNAIICRNKFWDLDNKINEELNRNVRVLHDTTDSSKSVYDVWDFVASANATIKVVNISPTINLLCTYADGSTDILGPVPKDCELTVVLQKDVVKLGYFTYDSQDIDLIINGIYGDYIFNSIDPKIKVMTLGDSITALGTTNRGWVRYFLLACKNYELIANTAVNSAELADHENTIYNGNPVQSDYENNVLGNQVQKILNENYSEPDVIIIAIGTNAGINITEDQIKNAYYDNEWNKIPLSSVDRKTDAGAFRYATETLHNKYPKAKIYWSSPIFASAEERRPTSIIDWNKSLEIATRFAGIEVIDTLRCGINSYGETIGQNGEYLIDGLHPNENGAKLIGEYIAKNVKPYMTHRAN